MIVRLLTVCCLMLLFSIAKSFVSVQIHRDVVYSPLSSCAFIRNVSFSQDPSIQSCIWECVHTLNCQTAVYYTELHTCQMYSELCDINRLQPSGTIIANVISYPKNHNPISACPATTTQVEETTTEQKMTYMSTDYYPLSISKCATWDADGITVAGNMNGTAGSDLVSLKSPIGIFVDENNSLFIADRDNHRIMKYEANSTVGVVVAGNGTAGNSPNQLNSPRGVAIDQYGFLIVGSAGNGQIQNFSNSSCSTIMDTVSNGVSSVGLLDLHANYQNDVYVTIGTNARIIMSNTNSQPQIIVESNNGLGSKTDQFNNPYGNCIDRNGSWYIADTDNHRVQKWLREATNGTTVAGITKVPGSNMTQLNRPIAVIVDNNGYLYILDYGNARIMKWTDDYSVGGTCIVGCSNTAGSDSDRLRYPRDLKFDQYGNLYVSDRDNHRIQKFMLNKTAPIC